MGVPSFFMWLVNNFGIKNIVNTSIKSRPITFYIDANCAFHPICFDTLAEHQKLGLTDEIQLEKDMFKNITNYLDKLITNVNPTHNVFIAVDGVAPMAKIQQQRKRRYKSVIDNDIKSSLKAKYNLTSSISWNNVVITPGTEFMEKLHQHILKYIDTSQNKSNIKYIYSSYHELGEGEHKILADIKKLLNDDNIVIYGLDADLIFLAMASQKNNIYLYRENTQLKEIFKCINGDFGYVSIEYLKQTYFTKMKELIFQSKNIINNTKIESKELKIESKDFQLLQSNLINDFIVLCFLIGNDFMPSIPSISIKANGLNNLIDNYIKILSTFNSYLLDSNLEINHIFLTRLLKELISQEHNNMINLYKTSAPKRCPIKIPIKIPIKNDNKDENSDEKEEINKYKYEVDMWKMENMQNIELTPFLENNETYSINLTTGTMDIIKWRYYEYYLGINDYYKQSVNILCQKYFEGISWNIKYYFDVCPNYNWYYSYPIAPFISDLSEYLNNNKLIKYHKEPTNCIVLTPLKQLMLVLPESYQYILPIKLQQSITKYSNGNLFHKHIILDTANKTVFWKCNPFLLSIDLELVNNIYNNVKLSSTDKKLDLIY